MAPARNQNPFDLVERNSIVAAVVKAGGAGGFVISHLLRHFELAAIAQVFGNPGRAEAVGSRLFLLTRERT
jgi:hypothetical protein